MADDELTVVIADGNTKSLRDKDNGSGKHLQIILAGEHQRIYDGHESLVLTGSAQTLQDIPAGATHATIYAEGATANDIARYWEDTVDAAPTSSAGKRIKDHEEIACAAPTTFRAINQTGTVTLRVSYYHYA